MEFISKRGCVLVILIHAACVAIGQTTTKTPLFIEKGGLAGTGYESTRSVSRKEIHPCFFSGAFCIDIGKASSEPVRPRFILFFEPQVNAVVLKHPGVNERQRSSD